MRTVPVAAIALVSLSIGALGGASTASRTPQVSPAAPAALTAPAPVDPCAGNQYSVTAPALDPSLRVLSVDPEMTEEIASGACRDDEYYSPAMDWDTCLYAFFEAECDGRPDAEAKPLDDKTHARYYGYFGSHHYVASNLPFELWDDYADLQLAWGVSRADFVAEESEKAVWITPGGALVKGVQQPLTIPVSQVPAQRARVASKAAAVEAAITIDDAPSKIS